jgi:lysophospholipase
VEDFDFYVRDLHQFVTEVVQPSQRNLTGSYQNLLLLGHSMGGCIASLYIEEHPTVFRAAVLCSPMHEPNVGLFPNIAVDTIAGLRELKGQSTKYAGKGRPYEKREFDERTMKDVALTHSRRRYDRILEMFEGHKETRVGGASYGWVREALHAADRAREHADKIEIDVLLLQATEDIAVTAEGQFEFRDVLNAKHPNRCRLLRMEGAYHELLIESDEYRKPAMDAIREFFSKHAEST